MSTFNADILTRYEKKVGIFAPLHFNDRKLFHTVVEDAINEHLDFCKLDRNKVSLDILTPNSQFLYKLSQGVAHHYNGTVHGIDIASDYRLYKDLKTPRERSKFYHDRLFNTHFIILSRLNRAANTRYSQPTNNNLQFDENPLLIIFIDEFRDKYKVIQQTITHINLNADKYINIRVHQIPLNQSRVYFSNDIEDIELLKPDFL